MDVNEGEEDTYQSQSHNLPNQLFWQESQHLAIMGQTLVLSWPTATSVAQ